MAEKIDVLIKEEDITERIKKLAAQISKDYEGKVLHMITVLRGGVFISTELAKHLTIPVTLDYMSVASYGNGTVSSGDVRIIKDLDDSIVGRDVLIVEDIVDSGRTLKYLVDNLKTRMPETLKLCTLLDKPDRRVVGIDVDYVGFTIPDEFVVGYGMDYAQKYRNLPYIGVVRIDQA